jgi:uncharacterized protein
VPERTSKDQLKPLPCRRFGRTNEVVPSLGLGTAPAGMGLPDDRAVALYHAAIDLGVTYLDTAPAYGRAQVQLGKVMPSRRDEVFLATKVNVEDGKGAIESLQESLRDLNTDRVDLAYVHALGGKNPDTVLSAEGALEGLVEARRRGLTRYVGFTAHNAPWKCVKALREAEVDAVMLAMNLVDRYTYDFEGRVLPEACDRDVGVAAMKVFGGAPGMVYEEPVQSKLALSCGYDHRTALRYALGLPGVALAVVGVYTEEELRLSLSWACDFEPLSTDERRETEHFGRKLARDWGPHYGSVV